jgi:hypothetical protein
MRMCSLRSGFAVIMVLLATCPTWAKSTVPKGAYIRHQVSSVKELAAQINKDPVVRNRFVRHFGVRPDKLTSYLLDNVTISHVSAATPKKVYIVTRSGQMVAKRTVLRPGAAIFVMKDTGEPLLVQICGNPVLKKLPTREKVKAEVPQVLPAIRVSELPVAPPAVPVTTQPLMAAALPTNTPPPLPPVDTVATVPAAVATTSSSVGALGAAKVAGPLLAAAGMVHKSSPPVVAEPATILGACAILTPVAFVFRRRRSK